MGYTRNTNNNTRNTGRWDELFAQSDTKLLEAMEEFERAKTFGDHLADKVADAAGSWWFVVGFCGVMCGWIILNTLRMFQPYAFDAPPFVLLNLVLSTIAALQAPVILMSQRRQADRDRLRAQHEYLMNLETNRQLQNMQEEVASMKDDLKTLTRETQDAVSEIEALREDIKTLLREFKLKSRSEE